MSRSLKRLRKSLKKVFKMRNVSKKTSVLVFLLLELIQPPIKQGLKSRIFLKSRVIIIIKKAIILEPISSL